MKINKHLYRIYGARGLYLVAANTVPEATKCYQMNLKCIAYIAFEVKYEDEVKRNQSDAAKIFFDKYQKL